MAAMTSSFGNFKIRGKRTSQIFVRSFVENFIKIHPSVWAVALSHTHTHTYIHTYIHTHTLGSIATYSVKLTEYKNCGTKKERMRRLIVVLYLILRINKEVRYIMFKQPFFFFVLYVQYRSGGGPY